jgi:uncharacterized protein HemX
VPETPATPAPAPQQPVNPQAALINAALGSGNPGIILLLLMLLLGGAGGSGIWQVLGNHTTEEVRQSRLVLMERQAELLGEVKALNSELKAVKASVEDQSRRTSGLESEVKDLKAQIASMNADRWTRSDQDRFADALERRFLKLEDRLENKGDTRAAPR